MSKNTVTREEAIAALAASTEAGDTNSYYITSAPGEVDEMGEFTVFYVGYAAADPEESDAEGDPCAFVKLDDGTTAIQGPSF